jgi:hypothetical protein
MNSDLDNCSLSKNLLVGGAHKDYPEILVLAATGIGS